MTADRIVIEPLTRAAFAPFGQVVSVDGSSHYLINAGRTERYHDLATIELGGEQPRPLISIFRGQPVSLPYAPALVERHPLGSQAFYPLSQHPYLVIVAPDEGGRPGKLHAFHASPSMGVNIGMNVWHGVLAPLEAVSDFLVVDRGGPGYNLEEFMFPVPPLVVEA